MSRRTVRRELAGQSHEYDHEYEYEHEHEYDHEYEKAEGASGYSGDWDCSASCCHPFGRITGPASERAERDTPNYCSPKATRAPPSPGRLLKPIRYVSIARAARRPSVIAQTTSD